MWVLLQIRIICIVIINNLNNMTQIWLKINALMLGKNFTLKFSQRSKLMSIQFASIRRNTIISIYLIIFLDSAHREENDLSLRPESMESSFMSAAFLLVPWPSLSDLDARASQLVRVKPLGASSLGGWTCFQGWIFWFQLSF